MGSGTFRPRERTVAIAVAVALVMGGLAAWTAPAGAQRPAPSDPAAPSTAAAPAGATTEHGGGCALDARELVVTESGTVWYTSTERDTVTRVEPDGSTTTFDDPHINWPLGLTVAPDGAVWFANYGANDLGRIAPDGTITFTADAADQSPAWPAVGSDGAIWYATDYTVGRIAPDGTATAFTDPRLQHISELTLGADGALWWIQPGTAAVGSIAPDGTITVHRDPDIINPVSLTAGSDGALWFATGDRGPWGDVGIARITTDGSVTRYDDPAIVDPMDLATGSDGAVWFTDRSGSISRIDTAGAVSSYTGNGPSEPYEIEPGPGGRLWFINAATDSLGTVTVAGEVSIAPSSCVRSPRGIALGPDGATWFTNSSFTDAQPFGRTIARLDDDGTIQEFTSPLLDIPTDIVAGPDGALWFANRGSVGRITVDGAISRHVTNAGAISMAVGPDGALWFTGWDSIGRITTAGAITTFPTAGVAPGVSDITAGPDGALWFTSSGADVIGRITTAGTITTYPAATSRSIVAGADGALWFTATSGLGRITTSGSVTTFPTAEALAGSITAGADGSLWFLGWHDGILSIGRATPSGEIAWIERPGLEEALVLAALADHGLWFASGYATGTSRTLGRIELLGAPGPADVTATPGKNQVSVTWEPPAAIGSGPVTSYSVVGSPGGLSCTRTPSQPRRCDFTGLTAGTSYTFTLTAVSAAGTGAPAIRTAVPTSGATFHDVTATRLLDSRTPNGGWGAPLRAGAPRPLQVTGRAGVPATASAVVLNTTVTDASSMSYVTAYPTGSARPTSSSINFLPGDTRANLVTVALSTSGQVTFANAVGSVNVVADVVGYYDDGNGAGQLYNPVAPQRALDSRDAADWWDGHPLEADGSGPDSVPIRGIGAVPVDDTTAVVVNITATQATNDTFVTAWAKGPQPSTSNLNIRAGDTVANLAVVPIEEDFFHLQLANAVGSVHVIIDVVGYYSSVSGDRFHPIAPTRILDDRNGTGLTGPWGPAQVRTVVAGGVGAIPTSATGVSVNITVTGSSTESFVSVYPHGVARPASSTLNFARGQTIANASYVGLGGGALDIANHLGTVDVIADVTGWFAPY